MEVEKNWGNCGSTLEIDLLDQRKYLPSRTGARRHAAIEEKLYKLNGLTCHEHLLTKGNPNASQISWSLLLWNPPLSLASLRWSHLLSLSPPSIPLSIHLTETRAAENWESFSDICLTVYRLSRLRFRKRVEVSQKESWPGYRASSDEGLPHFNWNQNTRNEQPRGWIGFRRSSSKSSWQFRATLCRTGCIDVQCSQSVEWSCRG